MEENILAVGKPSLVKKALGVILLFPAAYFCITGIIVFAAAGTAGALISILILGIPFILIALACLKQSSSITVTNKRVFGQVTRWFFFTRQVDLPLGSVSAVAAGFNSIRISTSFGEIAFKWITNQDEIASIVTGLLMARQSAKNSAAAQERCSGGAKAV